METGYCPKCGKIKELTRHHVLPQLFYGENDSVLLICRDCHDDIEWILPTSKGMKLKDDKAYFRITLQWLQGLNPMVVSPRGRRKKISKNYLSRNLIHTYKGG